MGIYNHDRTCKSIDEFFDDSIESVSPLHLHLCPLNVLLSSPPPLLRAERLCVL